MRSASQQNRAVRQTHRCAARDVVRSAQPSLGKHGASQTELTALWIVKLGRWLAGNENGAVAKQGGRGFTGPALEGRWGTSSSVRSSLRERPGRGIIELGP